MLKIDLPSSKSISNRALILRALSSYDVQLENLAQCDDTRVLVDALRNNTGNIDIGACGTAMRFLTAYLAVTPGEYFLTGSERMQQRPIKILVEALRSIGADIRYTGKEGFPPLLIKGKHLEGGILHIDGSVSSQYISALMMVGAFMPKGLQLKLTGKVVSKSYIEMTKSMISWFKEFQKDSEGTSVQSIKRFKVESDWSAASYWYEYLLLSKEKELLLNGLKEESLQGDSVIKFIFSILGIKTEFTAEGAKISKSPTHSTSPSTLKFNFSSCPDLVQTLVCTCVGTGIPFEFTGVETLRIKETDRLEAMKQELRKLGIRLNIVGDSKITWDGTSLSQNSYDIDPHGDHRMAMAFAPLRIKCPLLRIEDESVVTKSYPDYFQQLNSVCGF